MFFSKHLLMEGVGTRINYNLWRQQFGGFFIMTKGMPVQKVKKIKDSSRWFAFINKTMSFAQHFHTWLYRTIFNSVTFKRLKRQYLICNTNQSGYLVVGVEHLEASCGSATVILLERAHTHQRRRQLSSLELTEHLKRNSPISKLLVLRVIQINLVHSSINSR